MPSLILPWIIIALQTMAPGQPPASHHVPRVPLVARNTNWCGPAALAAVLQYHGEKTSAKEIADAIYLPGFKGSLNLDLLVFARGRGYEAGAGTGSEEKLREAVAGDRPVICMVTRRGPLATRNHMVVVRGYDRRRAVWFVDSGEGREETVSAAAFEAEWGASDRWMLVVGEKKADPAQAAERPGPCP